MSGLCGWLSAGAAAAPADSQQARLEAMAAPLRRFDGSELDTALGRTSAAAIAARPSRRHVYHRQGLLVAVWGDATLTGDSAGASSDSAAAQAGDESDNLAAALAVEWRSRGAQACAALSGPFALCILDEAHGAALLAVDRSGMHGMVYELSAEGLLFASSADALLGHPGASRALDPQSLYNYLYFHMVPGPASMYLGQRRLPPGGYLHYRGGRAELGVYWQIAFDEQQARPFKELKGEFLATLRGAVRRCADGAAVGAFLSGGTDSSTLAGILGQESGRAARSYSIGFDAPGYDEMAYARIAARHFGTDHHELYVSADDVVDAVPRMAALFDQPFGNASAVPAYYCARMARADGVTRLLGGDGGDELFGGNERYARQAIFSRYERMPSVVRQLLIEPLLYRLASGQDHKLLRKARSYIEQATVPLPARLETYNLLQRYGHGAVLEEQFLATIDPGHPLGSLNQAYWRTRGHSQINQILALDLKFTLADNDLPKVVKACELAGVEAAFPFLDDAMVAFSARLPPRLKLNGTRLRYFFKLALAELLPRAIINKRKHGFGLPYGVWLQQHPRLRQLAFDSLSDLKARRIVRASFIDQLLVHRLAEHPAYHGTMVWVLMMLEQWFQQRQR